MKKLMKILCVIVSVMLLSCMFIACDNDDGNDVTEGKVSDATWQQLLSAPSEPIDSCTSIMETSSTYSKTQAQEYGEWIYSKSTIKTDIKNNTMYTYSYVKQFVPEDERDEGDSEFVIEIRESYLFSYGEKYYSVDRREVEGDNDELTWSWSIWEMTKAEFITEFDMAKTSTELFYSTTQIYANLKSVFEFNDTTKEYELIQAGAMYMSLKFLDNGISSTQQYTSLEKTVLSLVDLNKTVVEIPDNLLSLVQPSNNA